MWHVYIYSPHIYDSVEIPSQYTSDFSSPDYTTSSSTITSTRSEQDMIADTVKLQEDPAYAVTN